MCIVNNLNFVQRLQAKSDEIAVYREYRVRDTDIISPIYGTLLPLLTTNKIEIKNRIRPYKNKEETARGLYSYLDRSSVGHSVGQLNIIYYLRGFAQNRIYVKCWIKTKDILAASRNFVGERIIVARCMYLDDESWDVLYKIQTGEIK